MGNFSRNTFDPLKQYVAVRMQQGVPLVDADWNELEDVTRHEVYNGLRAFAPNSALRGGLDVVPAGANDIVITPGTAVIDGRPVRLFGQLRYSTQRYANPATAAADGIVPVTPIPLTQPGGARTDVAYLDIAEREVTAAEDPQLINAAIGIETATRLRREVILRVAQGTATPPAPAAGHAHMAVALLNRNAGPITAPQIVDIKPYPLTGGVREVSFAPALLPTIIGGSSQPAWGFDGAPDPPLLWARKPAAQPDARGLMGVSLPDRARLIELRVRGSVASGGLARVRMSRMPLDGSAPAAAVNDNAITGAPFIRAYSLAGEPQVNGSTHTYVLYAFGGGTGATVEIHGISIKYDL